MKSVLFLFGCLNKGPQAGGFNNRNVLSRGSGGQLSQQEPCYGFIMFKSSGGLGGSPEASLLGL